MVFFEYEDIQVGTDITIHISKDKDGNISETFSSQIATFQR